MLAGGDVAEEVGAGGGGDRAADGRGDVVVARADVRDQRAEDVEGGSLAEVLLHLDVGGDPVEGDVAGSFDHHLHPGPARPAGQFAEDDQARSPAGGFGVFRYFPLHSPFNFDLNAADAADLRSVPGVSAELAGRIVAARERQGHFDRVDDLAGVEGMTPDLLARFQAMRTRLEEELNTAQTVEDSPATVSLILMLLVGFAAVFVATWVVQLILGVGVKLVMGRLGATPDVRTYLGTTLSRGAIIAAVILFLGPGAAQGAGDAAGRGGLGRRAGWWRDLLFGCLLAFGLMAAVFLVEVDSGVAGRGRVDVAQPAIGRLAAQRMAVSADQPRAGDWGRGHVSRHPADRPGAGVGQAGRAGVDGRFVCPAPPDGERRRRDQLAAVYRLAFPAWPGVGLGLPAHRLAVAAIEITSPGTWLTTCST